MTSCFFYVLVASNFVVTKTSKSFTNQWIKESIHCLYHYADEIVDTYFSHNLALGDFFLCLVGYAVSDFANFNTIQINEQGFGHFSCWKIYCWPSWGLRWRWDIEAIVCNASYGKSKNIDIFGTTSNMSPLLQEEELPKCRRSQNNQIYSKYQGWNDFEAIAGAKAQSSSLYL